MSSSRTFPGRALSVAVRRARRRGLVLGACAIFVCTTACDQFLTVGAIDEVFRDSQADSAMASASSLLQTASTTGDVVCDVRLNRTGIVQGYTGRNVLNTDADVQAAFRTGGYVKVVHQINRCGGVTNLATIGCAIRHNMIVEDLSDNG